MCKSFIEELDTAQSLIDWLDRAKWGKNPFEWVFRGQRSADWHLLPSAWRPNEKFLREGKWGAPPTLTKDQIQCEYEIVRRFFRIGDVQGLPLPGDTPDLRARIELNGQFDHNLSWPPRELEWMIAIAQHYGIPTRFIDWTRKPLIAAWFAAENAAQICGEAEEKGLTPPEGRFVVWALRRTSPALKKTGWELTSAPRSAVPNLHLQSGLFTFRRENISEFDANKNVIPFCQALAPFQQDDSKQDDWAIKGASVPWSQAGQMLTLLRDRFIQPATIYAGYDGVARSVKEHRWRR